MVDLIGARRRLLMQQTARLPSAYQEVEYIESTQEQYINTGIAPTIETEVICDFGSFGFINNDGDGNYRGPYGCSAASTNSRVGASKVATSATRVYTSFGDKVDIAYNTKIGGWQNRTLQSISKNGVYENGENVLAPYSGLAFGTTSIPIFVFARSSNKGTVERFVKIKLYRFTIKDNGVTVGDFIPCYRKSDGEIGLFDLVTKTLFVNQGTGTFIKGADV